MKNANPPRISGAGCGLSAGGAVFQDLVEAAEEGAGGDGGGDDADGTGCR